MSDNDGFYLAFEDRFRGSSDLIRARMQVYQPWLEALVDAFDSPRALDIGCGRGEWLELLETQGFKALGVDLDDGMLGAARQAGLTVELGDGLARVAGMESNSHALISAFHLVEHIEFDQLKQLVSEALRVLRPGGVLVMETPNPENLNVGANTFYLDPTHGKPLPPKLLAFLTEFYGYDRVHVLRLQEPTGLSAEQCPSLSNVLLNASPDYSVVAQKNADEARVPALESAFEVTHGVTLEQLAERYDRSITQGFEQHAQQIEQTQQQVVELQQTVQQLEQRLRHQLDETEQLIQELHSVYNSRSWRLTFPLRWGMAQLHSLREQGAGRRVRASLRAPVLGILRFVDRQTRRRPWLRNRMLKVLQRLGLYNRAARFYWNARVRQASHRHSGADHGLTTRQKAAQLAWAPGTDELSDEEILRRIRAEVREAEQLGGGE